ncbi:MAG: PD-(D/E)XK nuclease-like domain-containing protein [SAR324 cluster bacterium]|nr:PD-(D/E)XK nuclease-like domain-containing protein [SAR324 cluster bacterium]
MHLQQPGIYPDMDFETYQQSEGLNQTTLKKGISPQQFLPSGPESPLVFGIEAHMLLLEPEVFHQTFQRAPEGLNRRSDASKNRWNRLEQEQGKQLIKSNRWDGLMRLQKAYAVHPGVRQFMAEGMPEVSLFWKSPETSLMLKGRPDWMNPQQKYLVDLKLASRVDAESVRKAVTSRSCLLQAVWYLSGIKALTGEVFAYHLIFIQKHPPHLISLYQLTDSDIQQGEQDVAEAWNVFRSKSE